MLRPVIVNAAGPAIASAAIAIWSPAIAFWIVAVAQALAVVSLLFLRTTLVRRDVDAEPTHPVRALFSDIRGGVDYMLRTPWLLATLLFACLLVLLLMGPIEVLLPFAVKEQVPVAVQLLFGDNNGAGAFALAAIGLAPAFIAAGAIPVFLAVAATLIARLPKDEIEHPLDTAPPSDAVAADDGAETAGHAGPAGHTGPIPLP